MIRICAVRAGTCLLFCAVAAGGAAGTVVREVRVTSDETAVCWALVCELPVNSVACGALGLSCCSVSCYWALPVRIRQVGTA